jgi:hypothetical protein
MSFINEICDNSFFISTWRHKNPIPEFLKNITVEEYELILRLASESLILLRDSTSLLKFEDILNKRLSEQNQQSLKDVEKIQRAHIERLQQKDEEVQKKQKYIEKLELLNKQSIETYNQQKDEEVQKKQKYIEKLEVINRQSTESYNLLQQNFLSLQNSISQSFEKNLSCSLEKQNIFFSGQVSSIQKAFESRESIYKDTIVELKGKLESFQKQSLIEQNSSIKGKQGETSFDSLVNQFTSWKLEDTSKIPDACDRQSTIRGCKTLFELKNYTNKVPKTEVDKFKRNMEQHKDAPLGVFISLKTMIVDGAQELLYTEISSNNQILVYIQNFLSCDIDTIFSVINNYTDIAQKFYKKISEADDSVDLQSKIDSIKPILNSSFKEISDMINENNKNKKFMIDKITSQHSSVKLHIDKIKLMFESIFNLLFHEETKMFVEELLDSDKSDKKGVKRKKKSNTPVVGNE